MDSHCCDEVVSGVVSDAFSFPLASNHAAKHACTIAGFGHVVSEAESLVNDHR